MRNFVEKFYNKIKNKIKEVFSSDLSAKQIALNCTVGILVGLLIPMGLQTLGVIVLVAIFRLNFVMVVFATLITNPVTFIFIYFSAFKIGNYFINSNISWIYIDKVLNNPEFESILNLSFDSLQVIYAGLILESVVLGPLTYLIVYHVAQSVKKNAKKNQRLGHN